MACFHKAMVFKLFVNHHNKKVTIFQKMWWCRGHLKSSSTYTDLWRTWCVFVIYIVDLYLRVLITVIFYRHYLASMPTSIYVRILYFAELSHAPSEPRFDIIGISNSPFSWIYEQTWLPEHGLRLHLHIFPTQIYVAQMLRHHLCSSEKSIKM